MERRKVGYSTFFPGAELEEEVYVENMFVYREFSGARDHNSRARSHSTQHWGGRALLEHDRRAGVWFALRLRSRLHR